MELMPVEHIGQSAAERARPMQTHEVTTDATT